MDFAKIYASILDSSIWEEDKATRIVFITMLLKQDPTTGFVKCFSVERLAALANVSVGEAGEAVKILEAPDRRDPAQPHQGRRIKKAVGGWVVLNGPEYFLRSMRAQWAKAQREYREKKKGGVCRRSAGSLAERQACKEMEQGEGA